MFRAVAALVIPLLILGCVELALRVSGYGYPASFFVKTKISGTECFVPNDQFGYRFFPPALARTPISLRVAAQKPPHTFRIFLFGESAAQGDPDPTFGAGRYLETLLRDRFPGTDFEVVCVAMTAINSHVILPIARECARLDGDLWVVYMGNNEMVGPFGAGTVFGSRTLGVNLIRAELALKATKVGQWLERLAQRGRNPSLTPKIWSGLNMFKDHQLRWDDPNRLRSYANFKENLADILRAGQRAGVPVILSAVGSNLKDCAPFSSLHPAGFAPSQQVEWDAAYQPAIRLAESGDYSGALQQFAQAAAIDPQFAELHYRAALCHLALTNAEAARHEFELARDDDTLAFRADTRINDIVKDAASTHAGHGVSFLDAAEELARRSPGKISGNELFYEHVHLNFDGNYWLGRAFAEHVAKALPKEILTRATNDWADAARCDRQLGVSPWDRCRVWQENFSRVSVSPFTEQLNDVPRAKFYMAKLKELNAELTEKNREASRAMYEEALAASPNDYFLRGNYAQFLDQIGDLDAAVQQETRVSELLPQTPATSYKIGALRVRQGNTREAEASFSRALAMRADYVPALNDLGLLLANQQKTTEAAGYFSRALQLNSGYVETHLNWGFMEQCHGKMDAALVHYRAAADLQPEGPAAHFFPRRLPGFRASPRRIHELFPQRHLDEPQILAGALFARRRIGRRPKNRGGPGPVLRGRPPPARFRARPFE